MNNRLENNKTVDIQALTKLVEETFNYDAEVLEVARYLILRSNMLELAMRSFDLGNTEVQGIAPEQIMLVREYESGFLNNKFYIDHFSIIKAMSFSDDCILNSRSLYLERSKEDISYGKIVRELMPQRFQSLTTLCYLAKGASEAKRFDFLMRPIIQVSEIEDQYFRKYGL